MSRGSAVFIPRRIPRFIRLYFLYVAQLLHETSKAVKIRKRIYLGLPKHLKPLPSTRCTVVVQIEQAIFTGNGDYLSPEAHSELDADPATAEVVSRVRLHGPLESFEKSSAVVDYSALNIGRLRELPELTSHSAKFCTIAPLLGNYSTNREPRNNVSVATMYGSPERGRRGRIASMLSDAGIKVRNIHNFEDYEIAFRDVAILLNFRQVEHFSTPEELRILPALLQGVVVIAEDTPFARQSLCADFLVFAEVSKLTSVIMDLQCNYSGYWTEIFGGDRFSDFVRTLEVENDAVAAHVVQTVTSTKM